MSLWVDSQDGLGLRGFRVEGVGWVEGYVKPEGTSFTRNPFTEHRPLALSLNPKPETLNPKPLTLNPKL